MIQIFLVSFQNGWFGFLSYIVVVFPAALLELTRDSWNWQGVYLLVLLKKQAFILTQSMHDNTWWRDWGQILWASLKQLCVDRAIIWCLDRFFGLYHRIGRFRSGPIEQFKMIWRLLSGRFWVVDFLIIDHGLPVTKCVKLDFTSKIITLIRKLSYRSSIILVVVVIVWRKEIRALLTRCLLLLLNLVIVE